MTTKVNNMSSTEVEISPPRTDADNEEIHLACMGKLPLIAMCGISLAAHRKAGEDEQITCVVCKDLEEHASFCPHGGVCHGC